jgi:trehalose-phosphatase
VAVVSGRALRDVRRRVALPGAFYAGCHGMEIQGPGFTFRHSEAALRSGAIDAVEEACRRSLRGVQGLLIERKPLSVAVHYRRVSAPARPGLLRVLARLRRRLRARPVTWRRGRLAWEALPRVGWGKGRAAAMLRRLLGNPFPVALGDDLTDEGLFRAARHGISVRVAPEGATEARYTLSSQAEVPGFLERLDAALKEEPHVRQAA